MILITTLVLAHVWMFLTWLVYRYQGNAMLADVVWSLGTASIGLIYLISNATFNLQIILDMMLLIIWSLRLSGYLFWTRLRTHHQDSRYEFLKKDTEKNPNTLFRNYQIQAFLQWLIAIPWFFISIHSNQVDWPMHLIAQLIVIIGLMIETIADNQLHHFKKQKNKGVCQIGLWAYSRHPNYFGELLVWFGFCLAANSLLAFISVISLYLIMRYVTGPLTEQTSLVSKGELYKAYQRQTPMIFPKFYK